MSEDYIMEELNKISELIENNRAELTAKWGHGPNELTKFICLMELMADYEAT
jgi:hypothetical protein